MIAKKTILLIVLILTMVQPCAALSGDKIVFTNIPDGLDLVVNESIDFSVTLKNGGIYSDVCIQLRNIPDGIAVVGNNDYKLMDQGSSVTYNLTLFADENIESGIYAFEISDSSNYDFRTWTTIYLAILNAGDSPVYNIIEEEAVVEEVEDVVPIINDIDVKEKISSTKQEENNSITEESSDSIMDTAVVLTYTELSIAAVVEAISITIINLILVVVVGIVRKRKYNISDTSNSENITVDNDIWHDNNQDDGAQENFPGGEYDNDDTE